MFIHKLRACVSYPHARRDSVDSPHRGTARICRESLKAWTDAVAARRDEPSAAWLG